MVSGLVLFYQRYLAFTEYYDLQLVTGPKTDLWLVKTVGLLLMVTGLVLVMAAIRRRISPEIILLAIGNALVLTGIEMIYWYNGTLSAIYLLDAVLEILVIIGWLILWRRTHGNV